MILWLLSNSCQRFKDLNQLPAGIYIVKENGVTRKVMKK